MESYESTGKIPESDSVQKQGRDEKLSENEALLYQDYATKKEGVGFSEKADAESYAEADALITKIREAHLDWLDIDWDDLQIQKIEKIEEAEKRLDFVIRHLVAQGKDDSEGTLAKLSNRFSATVIPLMTAMTILSGSVFPQEALAESVNVYKREQIVPSNSVNVKVKWLEHENQKINVGNSFEVKINVATSIQKWLEEGGDIAKKVDSISINTVDEADTRGDVHVHHQIRNGAEVLSDAFTHPEVTVVMKDGRQFVLRGGAWKSKMSPTGSSQLNEQIVEVYSRGIIDTIGILRSKLETEGN